MKTFNFLLACLMMVGCTNANQNPFFTEFETPYGAPDFDKIKTCHYEPAILKGIEQQNAIIQQIVGNPEAPTFENTIVALDNSGEILNRTAKVFFALTSADTNDELMALEEKFAPMITTHQDNIYLNVELFKRVEAIHQQEAEGTITLDKEQSRLLDKYYKDFIQSGAALDQETQNSLREINKQLSSLGIAYENHALNENNKFKLVIDNTDDLAGLPSWLITSAAEEAQAAGMEGKWLFTLQSSSRIPFLQYADNRTLRQQVYEAYINKGNHNDDNDNKKIIHDIIALRQQKAKLMGYDCYSNYVLNRRMAQNEKNVMDFLNQLWPYALQNAKKELAEMQVIMDRESKNEKIAGWDWWYYAEKLRQEKYNLNEDDIKPYFSLENVRKGLFQVANQLYGITMTPLNDIPVYGPDVEVFRVDDAEGKFLGLFYSDYYPRAGKRSGAWMDNFRDQKSGQRPLIFNVASFTKPTADTPSLLNLDEVSTMFHEFGHALHGMLSQCTYLGTSGTNVARDFVELPSQIMEHWAMAPEVLKMYAKHYQTGETIPDSLIQKIQRQSEFNQGFNTTELLAASLLDMHLHNLKDLDELNDVTAFEQKTMDQLGLIPEIAPRYRSTYFTHIIGGYDAGYYSYLWSEVLDADAFEAFKEKGLFDKATANAFKSNILEKGDSDDPMTLYRTFRGSDPDIHALLKNRGLQ